MNNCQLTLTLLLKIHSDEDILSRLYGLILVYAVASKQRAGLKIERTVLDG